MMAASNGTAARPLVAGRCAANAKQRAAVAAAPMIRCCAAAASGHWAGRQKVGRVRKLFAGRGCVGGGALRALPQRSMPVVASTAKPLDPVVDEITYFGPPTVANLGPGFDFLGVAVEGAGDLVTATVLPGEPGKVVIESIEGDGGRLTLVSEENCVGVAAIETLKIMGPVSCGVSLKLVKGLPLGSGLGSSAASAAAAACAVNHLFGSPLSRADMVPAGLVSEATVSGYHADNIAPAIMGGFILVNGYEPLDLVPLKWGAAEDLWFTLVTPVFEAPTREMRAALPAEVPFKSLINNSMQGAALVTGILTGKPAMVGKALDSDAVVEPARGPLIPGFTAAKAAAKAAGASGCTISGAGPTIVAIVDSPEMGKEVADAIIAAVKSEGGLETERAYCVKLCQGGACERDPKDGFEMGGLRFA